MKLTDVICRSCGEFLCHRQGATLIRWPFELDLKRSHTIVCRRCGEHTPIAVDRHEKGIDTRVKVKDNRL